MTITTETTVEYFVHRPSGCINGILYSSSRAIRRCESMEGGSYVIERTSKIEHDDENPMHALINGSWSDAVVYRKEV